MRKRNEARWSQRSLTSIDDPSLQLLRGLLNKIPK